MFVDELPGPSQSFLVLDIKDAITGDHLYIDIKEIKPRQINQSVNPHLIRLVTQVGTVS